MERDVTVYRFLGSSQWPDHWKEKDRNIRDKGLRERNVDGPIRVGAKYEHFCVSHGLAESIHNGKGTEELSRQNASCSWD